MPKKYPFLIFLSLVGGFFWLRSLPEPRPQKIVLVPQHKLLLDTNNLIPSLELEELDSLPYTYNMGKKFFDIIWEAPTSTEVHPTFYYKRKKYQNDNSIALSKKDIFKTSSCKEYITNISCIFDLIDDYWAQETLDEKLFYVIQNFIHHTSENRDCLPSKKLLVMALQETLEDLKIYHKHFIYQHIQKFAALIPSIWLSKVTIRDNTYNIVDIHKILICNQFCPNSDTSCKEKSSPFVWHDSPNTWGCNCPSVYYQYPNAINRDFLKILTPPIPKCDYDKILKVDCSKNEAAIKAFYDYAVKEKYAIYKYPLQYFMMAVFERNLHRILKSSENPFKDTLIVRLQDIPRVAAIQDNMMNIKAQDSLKAVEDARSFLDGF
jgi:hypothetical protein